MLDTSEGQATYPIVRAVVLTVIVGLIGLGTHTAAEAFGWEFPSYGASLSSIVWKVGTFGVLVLAMRRYEGRTPAARDLGLVAAPDHPRDRTRPAILGLLAAAALFVVVSQLPWGTLAGDANAYDGAAKATLGVLLVELLVRYPITVFTEEAFFRGFLQPRLVWAAPVVSGVLWAGHHFQQASTILSLVPLGIAFGVIRWWTGDVRVSGAIHYTSNAAFLIANYG